VADGIVGEKTWIALMNAKITSYPAGLVLKSKGTGYEILEKDRYINVVRIDRSALKSINVLNSKTAFETMTSMYSRLNPKPTFMINGGLYGMANGVSIHLFVDEGKQVASGVFSKFALIVNKDGSYKMDFYKPSANDKDVIGSSPSLVIDGKVNIDLTGLVNDKAFVNNLHPRSALGMDDKYFYIVAIDGRRTWAKGMSINTLAKFMLDIGCKYAFNLDGGGSTRIQGKDGKPINEPLENRAIDNSICFYLK